MTEWLSLRNNLSNHKLAEYIAAVPAFLEERGINLEHIGVRDELSSVELPPELADLAAQLSALLRPVRPKPCFRAKLKQDLLAAAREREFTAEAAPNILTRHPVAMGAAIAGSVLSLSVAGAAALYYYHQRN